MRRQHNTLIIAFTVALAPGVAFACYGCRIESMMAFHWRGLEPHRLWSLQAFIGYLILMLGMGVWSALGGRTRRLQGILTWGIVSLFFAGTFFPWPALEPKTAKAVIDFYGNYLWRMPFPAAVYLGAVTMGPLALSQIGDRPQFERNALILWGAFTPVYYFGAIFIAAFVYTTSSWWGEYDSIHIGVFGAIPLGISCLSLWTHRPGGEPGDPQSRFFRAASFLFLLFMMISGFVFTFGVFLCFMVFSWIFRWFDAHMHYEEPPTDETTEEEERLNRLVEVTAGK